MCRYTLDLSISEVCDYREGKTEYTCKLLVSAMHNFFYTQLHFAT